MRVGIFDHVSIRLGGSQLVVAWMARLLARDADVEVIHSGQGYSLARLAEAFELDLSPVKERIVADAPASFAISGLGPMLHHVRRGWRMHHGLTRPYDLFIYAGHGVPPFSHAPRALVYCHFPFETRMSASRRFGKRWEGRRAADRRVRLAVSELLWKRRMRGYGAIVGNSRFTCDWIERLWGMRADVVYPPAAVQTPRLEKQNLIASIGRFIATDRKNHLEQLSAFRRFLENVAHGWRLCVIGFCADFPEDRDYVAKLRELAGGLPVSFLVNEDRRTVLAHLAQAKLFWHTAGLREQARSAPRHMEHFGIATVEAMSAGCVPVVAAYGGQPEIVGHGTSGFTCRDDDELVRHSVHLATDDQMRADMARKALERSRDFRPEVFEERLRRLVFRAS